MQNHNEGSINYAKTMKVYKQRKYVISVGIYQIPIVTALCFENHTSRQYQKKLFTISSILKQRIFHRMTNLPKVLQMVNLYKQIKYCNRHDSVFTYSIYMADFNICNRHVSIWYTIILYSFLEEVMFAWHLITYKMRND